MSDAGPELPRAQIVAEGTSRPRAPRGSPRATMWRVLSVVPVLGAGLAIHAMWGLGLGRPGSAGWGIAGEAMSGLIVFGGVLASTWLLGGGAWRRGRWIAVPAAFGIAAAIAPVRQRAHDDAAFVQARASEPLLADYLAWGQRHRAEALALVERSQADQRASDAIALAKQVEPARRQLRAVPLEGDVRAFLDGLLGAAATGKPAELVVTVIRGKIEADPAVESELGPEALDVEVVDALRSYLPAELVNVTRTGVGDATVEVRYDVRPWVRDGAPVIFSDAAFADLNVGTRQSYPGIELVLDLQLIRTGTSAVERRVLVHPAEQFEARTLAILIDQYGRSAVYHAMGKSARAQLAPMIRASLASVRDATP
jgi:hypothetical protein